MYKSAKVNHNHRNILPTNHPYMVQLHRFYETPSAIYLLLQYASGGKLWDYVGAYLRAVQDQGRETGPGGGAGAPTQEFQNVYTGYKVHTTDNKRKSFKEEISKNNGSESDTSTVTLTSPVQGRLKEVTSPVQIRTDGISSLVGNGKDGIQSSDEEKENKENRILNGDGRVVFSKGDDNVHLNQPVVNATQELSVSDFQLDIGGLKLDSHDNSPMVESLDDKCGFPESAIELQDDSLCVENDANEKVQYQRFTSFSSEENVEDEELDSSGVNPSLVERQNSSGAGFQDLLEKHSRKIPLENFSINSFDSADGVIRVGSTVSDNIEAIQEVNENGVESEVFNCDNNGPDTLESHMVSLDVAEEPHSENDSNQICDSVERALSAKSEIIEENCDSEDDIIKSSKALLRNVERTLSQIDSDNVNEKSEIESSEKDTQNVENKEVCDEPEEPSIYDFYRPGDSSESQSSINNNSEAPQNVNLNNSNELNDGKILFTSTPIKPNSLDEHPTDLEKESKSRSRTNSSEGSKTRSRLSLPRLRNSTEISRSASTADESSSPMKSRQRTISHLFEQLDMSAQNPEQIKIPESFIRRWAAEIIVALSRLHSLGIICR